MALQNPTLIIGLGGTGMKIGHALKRLLYQDDPNNLWHQGDNQTGKAAFCFVENAQDEWRGEIKPFINNNSELFDEDEIIKVTDFDPYYYVDNIDNYPDLKRVHDINSEFPRKAYTQGLGAHRQAGRVAAFSHFDKIHRKLQIIINNFNEAVPGNLQRDTMSVYIINSICGGTGASLYFDVAAIIDDVANTAVNKKAFFVGPNYYLTEKETKGITRNNQVYKRMQCNAWAMMKEFEFFLKNQKSDRSILAKYSVRRSRFKDKIKNHEEFSPATSAFIFDEKTSVGRGLPHGREFFNNLANILYFSIISESNSTYKTTIEVNKSFDATSKNDEILHSTITYKTIKYPKKAFEEYFFARYRYDMFKNILFSKDFPEEQTKESKGIEGYANDFFDRCFSESNGLVFQDLIGDFNNQLNSSGFKFITNLNLNSFVDENKLLDADKLSELTNETNNQLNHALDTLESKYKSFFEEISQFDLKDSSGFDADKILDDELKNSLQEVLNKYGIYGILGFDEGRKKRKGFIEVVKNKLAEFYSKLNNELSIVENRGLGLKDDQTKAQQNLLDLANAGRFSFKSKKLEKREDDINRYIHAIKDLLNNEINETIIKLKMKLLHQIAIGRDTEATANSYFNKLIKDTHIDYYEKCFNTLSSSSETNSLMTTFLGKKKTDNSIKTWYEDKLPQKFIQSDEDVFTFHLPNKLSTYVDSDEYDNWAKNTDLSAIYDDNVTIDLGDLKNVDINYFIELANTHKYYEDVEILLNSIDTSFKNKIQSSDNITGFLNREFDEVFNNTQEERQKEVKRLVNEPVYLINRKAGGYDGVSYSNIHPKLKDVVIKNFPITKSNIVTNANMPEDEVVIVSILEKVRFDDIHNSFLLKTAYESRNKSIIFPHIFPAWNRLDTLEGFEPFIKLDTNKCDLEKLEYFDAFLISDLLDKCRKKGGLDFLFLKDENMLDIKNLLSKPPIFYDEIDEQYFASQDFKFELYEGELKFVISNLKKDIIKLKFSKTDINFSDMLLMLMSADGFSDNFGKFINTLAGDNLKAKLKDALEENMGEIYDELLKENKTRKKLLENMSTTSEVSEADTNYVNNYMMRLMELADKLFKVKIR